MKSLARWAIASLGYEVRRAATPGRHAPGDTSSDHVDLLQSEVEHIPDETPGRHAPRDAFTDQVALLGSEVGHILDVGAHHGHTVAQYRNLFPGASIHAFEPHPESFELLQARFAADPQVEALHYAIADAASPRMFYINQHDAAHSLLQRPSSGPKYYGDAADMVGELKVNCTTIDRFCEDRGLSEVSILKMDIQGGELQALDGAVGKLSQGLISLIYTEVKFVPHYEGGPMYHHLAARLETFGYTLYGLYNAVHAPNGQLRFGDAIFASPWLRRKISASAA